MTTKFMTDPVKILVKRDELTLEVNKFGISISATFDCRSIYRGQFLSCKRIAGNQAIFCCRGKGGVEV